MNRRVRLTAGLGLNSHTIAIKQDDVLFTARLGYRKIAANLSREIVGKLDMAGNRVDCTTERVGPQRMSAPFALEIAPVLAQVAEEGVTLHSTTTVS
jgi:hypothetical protein